jgi:hypothetical protein
LRCRLIQVVLVLTRSQGTTCNLQCACRPQTEAATLPNLLLHSSATHILTLAHRKRPHGIVWFLGFHTFLLSFLNVFCFCF